MCVLARLPLPWHADIRCELACELVSEPEAELDVVDAAADAELADLLGCELDLGSGLQDKKLGDQQVVLVFESCGDVDFIRDERRRVELRPAPQQLLQNGKVSCRARVVSTV